MKFLIASIVLVGCIVQPAWSDPNPGGRNVCNISVPVKKDITVEVPLKYTIQVQDMCGILPCMKTRTETKMDQVIKTVVKLVHRSACCDGYTESPEHECVPICLKSCQNGKCVAPNQCQCRPEPTESSPGFVGPTCGRFTCLSVNKWGSKCDRECNCPMNAYCSASTGKCLCHPGWKGENCSQECGRFDTDLSCGGDGDESLLLPPIMEPDTNIEERESWGASSAKLLPPPDSLKIEPEVPLDTDPSARPSDVTVYSLVALLSMSIVCWVVLVLFVIKKRFNGREDPYYATCSSRAPGDDTNYSTSSYYSPSNPTIRSQRSTGPTDFLSKNLSFASTTRNILLGIDTSKSQQQQAGQQQQHRQKIALAPKIETDLIESQRASSQNVYSEPTIANNLSDTCSSYAIPRSLNDTSHISLNISSATSNGDHEDDEHIYQVPKSPSAKSGQHSFNESHTDDGVSNIYEEIKPKGSGRV